MSATEEVQNVPVDVTQPEAPVAEKPVKEKKAKVPKEKKPKAPKTASHPPYFEVWSSNSSQFLLILLLFPEFFWSWIAFDFAFRDRNEPVLRSYVQFRVATVLNYREFRFWLIEFADLIVF